jgi:hypothetical protein
MKTLAASQKSNTGRAIANPVIVKSPSMGSLQGRPQCEFEQNMSFEGAFRVSWKFPTDDRTPHTRRKYSVPISVNQEI